MALVLQIWIRSRVCSSAENFLNHRLNRRLVSSLHRFNRCLKSSWLGFCIASGTTSDRYTDGHRCFRWLADEPTPKHRFNRCYCVEFWPVQCLWTLLLPLHRRPSDVPMPQWRFFRCPSVDSFNLVQIWSTLHRCIHRCPYLRTIGPSSALGLAGP